MMRSNQHAHFTAKERTSLSFPSKILLERNLLKDEILDFGCGFGKDVEVLKGKGFDITGFDPYYYPHYPKKQFETIICHYVLNVLFKKEQAKVLTQVSQLLKPGGTAYFAVRRDIRNPGFRIHKVHEVPTYQTNVKLPYGSVFLNEYCEIYAYHRIVDIDSENPCIFCNPAGTDFIIESAVCYAIFDKYPVTEGHALVIPKRHTRHFFELEDFEKMSLWLLAEEVKEKITEELRVTDFNVGFNIGTHAGQTIPHTHLHLIPRRADDVEEPIGGIRNVIPGKGNYKKTQ